MDNNTHSIEFEGSTYNVKEIISIEDVMGFVRTVAYTCFDDSDFTYNPELKDFSIRVETFKRYTDVELPDDVTELYSFVYKNDDLFMTVISSISRAQFDAVLKAVDDKIQYIIDTNVNAVNASLSEMSSKIDSFERQFTALFSSIDKDDMGKIMSLVANYDENALALAQKRFDEKRG